jgi:hypothetical protein
MFRKLGVVLLMVVFLRVATAGYVGVGVAWLAVVYVFVRAWPAVRSDFGRLAGVVRRPGRGQVSF